MRTGTCYFASNSAAIRYYLTLCDNNYFVASATVSRKRQDGEIKIGKPPYDPATQRIYLIDEGCRYRIEDIEPANTKDTI